MHLHIITLYCVCDDFLRSLEYRDDPQCQMTTAEVMTVGLVAATYFDGNQEKSRVFLKDHGYMPRMLGKSRFNRRWHQVPEFLWQKMLWLLGQAAQQNTQEDIYVIDSVPLAVCDNIRIRRNRLYPLRVWGKQCRGYCASKRRYYYGLKGHLLITTEGIPVEFTLTPASTADMVGLRMLSLDLPAGSVVTADAAYTNYGYENALLEQDQIRLVAARKKNSLRPHLPFVTYLAQHYRKRIETTFSTVTEWLGRRLHAVTPQGWERKIFVTVLAYALQPA